MITGPIIAEIAALVGDPTRATMVSALLDGRVLTASELAAAWNVSPGTVRNWASQRRLPSVKINGALRFRPSDLQRWLTGRKRPVAGIECQSGDDHDQGFER